MPERNLSGKNESLTKIMAFHFCCAIIFCLFFLIPFSVSFGQSVGAYDLIGLINGMRSANGLGALSVDSALMACAQSTAETMAASNMTWHIGNVSGRASSFGYNNYNTCFATENFTMGTADMSISQIAASWSDATHMIPATSSKYCHIGAGVANAGNGMVYFVVQAAYPAGVNGCGYAKGTGSAGTASSGTGGPVVSSYILPVVTSTPSENGNVIHTVQEGQTLWAISQAYGVSIEDIQSWNNMYNSTALSLGQNLYIPAKNEAGSTPTPQTELTVFPTANASGRFYHIVGEGDTLWSISELWKVPLNTIYQANGMTADDSIGLGWEILIPVTATATVPPTETPTATMVPTDTEMPTETEAYAEETETASDLNKNNNSGILHIPAVNSRTIIIFGIFLSVLIGGTIIAINLYWKKK
ncbi:MAG: LysM peptidoglycan-binding domain-containing protein [Anaerolineaceae bacterium]|nr:LysM peptidoglycan-binding domain-containing protein [Anaerolineaceae bacterium]